MSLVEALPEIARAIEGFDRNCSLGHAAGVIA
jgi:DNA polymerase III alpha subunit